MAVVIFPNQLFSLEDSDIFSSINKNTTFFIVEDSIYFHDKCGYTGFNINKLIYQRICMKNYEKYLKSHFTNVKYIDFANCKSDYLNLFNKFDKIHIYRFNDWPLRDKFAKIADKLVQYDNPTHLHQKFDEIKFADDKKSNEKTNKKTNEKTNEIIEIKNHRGFYKWSLDKLSKKYNWDLSNYSKSQDKYNRRPFDTKLPGYCFNSADSSKDDSTKKAENVIEEAAKYILKNIPHFTTTSNKIGTIVENYKIIYKSQAHNHDDAIKQLDDFIKNKLLNFGPFQDSLGFIADNLSNSTIDTSISTIKMECIFHSVLSPAINIGLITTKTIIEKIIKFIKLNEKSLNKESLKKYNQSIEAFLRQVIGWREYMWFIYNSAYFIKDENFFSLFNEPAECWWNGSTDVIPVDIVIKRAWKFGYLHHIERLMVVLCLMTLCEINPGAIHKWFMEFALDSYSWVMLGNTYGMGYATTLIMQKPYLATSNYISGQSKLKKGEWGKEWDALFYRFLYKHKKEIKENSGTKIYLRNLAYFEKKPKKESDEILKIANDFIKKVTI